MSERDDDRDFVPAFRDAYSRTPLPPDVARARLDAVLSRTPSPKRGWFEPRTFTLRPVAAMAAAAGLLVAGGVIGAMVASRTPAPGAGGPARTPGATPIATAAGTTHPVRFVLVAPASRVTVVGDFNGWDAEATPMRVESGAWTTTVAMSTGWHAYAFVVDGEWLPDPRAPLAPADDYGSRRSVVVVGGSGT